MLSIFIIIIIIIIIIIAERGQACQVAALRQVWYNACISRGKATHLHVNRDCLTCKFRNALTKNVLCIQLARPHRKLMSCFCAKEHSMYLNFRH